MTSAIVVAIQTGTASTCSICGEQGKKKKRSDNEHKVHHKRLSALTRTLLRPPLLALICVNSYQPVFLTACANIA